MKKTIILASVFLTAVLSAQVTELRTRQVAGLRAEQFDVPNRLIIPAGEEIVLE